jgi:isopenicillin-N epimerase
MLWARYDKFNQVMSAELTLCQLTASDTVQDLYRKHWGLNPNVDFLNHGSFGACPTQVLDAQRQWVQRLESDPIEFLAPERSLLPRIDAVRDVISRLVNASAKDIVMVRNATEGVNAVIQSFPFLAGDEVVITSHGYNACNNAVRYAADRRGAAVVVANVPFPLVGPSAVMDAVTRVLTDRTRLVLMDHVTSPTGLVFPIEKICQLCHSRGIRVMIDGAHGPGMVPVDIQKIGADYYTANHHKWLCGPKTSGFLYVDPQWQAEVRPTTISHGANTDRYGVTRFQAEFNWVGTFDPTPILVVPDAIDFVSTLFAGGLEELMSRNRNLVLAGRNLLLDRLGLESPAPEAMLGSLASIVVPNHPNRSAAEIEAVKTRLFTEFRIEVPIFRLNPQQHCLRISAQAYNCLDQYERLAETLKRLLMPD